MPREALGAPLADALSPEWRAALVRLGGAWIFLLLLFNADWLAMADQWWNSSTYNHILLIPAIIGWLVWLRVPQLLQLTPRPWLPGVAALAGVALVWVLGAFSGLSLAQQAGAAALLPASALLVLGPRVCAGLAFPLGYMAFLVPFGDELVPPLQMFTAKLTIALTHLSAIPASIDGVFIDTPAGLFEVAEACSGVKFLIAMIAFGVLVANVCFRSWRRRAVFLAFAVIVPILANGVRAWGTIYVAQFKGAAYAGGFDHIVYGWLFFALVIALVIAGAWRFFDRSPDDPMLDPVALNGSLLFNRLERFAIAPVAALAAVALIGFTAQGWAAAADRLSAPIPAQLFLPDVPGWQRIDYAPAVWWEPRAAGADHRLLGSYRNSAGGRVEVFFALYSAQGEGREAGGFGEGALRPGGAWSWLSPGVRVAGAHTDRLMTKGRVTRLAETYYRTGSLLTGSNARLKLANMRDRLLLREHPTMLLILSAEQQPGQRTDATLDAFRKSAGPLDRWMDRIAGVS
ncbi:MAG TPA: exosortase A [Novosphingobium sp.]|nr:exosortase A [Novosphingobium sp.]